MKEIDALVAKASEQIMRDFDCRKGLTSDIDDDVRNEIVSDHIEIIRSALMEARALGLEEAVKWHEARVESLKDSRAYMIQRGRDQEASDTLRLLNEHDESANRLRALKGD